jgi:phage RecT family recombinase
MTTPTKALTVSEYMRQPEQLARFVELLGDQQAQAYVQSVLIEVASDDKLRECSPQSIFKSALRAATLGLSCDKSLKQAWLVPYNKKVKTPQGDKWIKEAQFQPHYLGLRSLAMRTGKYWTINVSPVYDGQRVLYNPLTGLHVVQETNGFQGEPKSYNPGLVDVTNRRAKDMKVIGWIAYYKAKNGEEKSIYMSVVEIDDHARKYVKEYEKNQNWNDSDKRQTMEMKTVLRRLLDWTDKSGKGGEELAAALKADAEPEAETVDVQAEDVPAGPQHDLHPMNIDEARQTIGVINGKEKPLGNMTSDELNYVFANSIKSGVAEAARIILVEDFRMTPPQADPPKPEKKSTDQLQKELGF